MIHPSWTRFLFAIALCAIIPPTTAVAQSKRIRSAAANTTTPTITEVTRERAIVRYEGLPSEYADAIANICDTLGRFLQQEFNLEVPDKVTLLADLKKGNRTAISNDGRDQIHLTLERLAQLKAPPTSRVFSVYGIASELADLAMQKTLNKPVWMSDDAWQGLRYYLASESVDRLNSIYNRKLWPDSYDYSAEGMALFKSRVRGGNSGLTKAAGEWHKLSSDFGRVKIGGLLREFRKADAEERSPDTAVKALQTNGFSRSRSRLQRWYSGFEPQLVQSKGKIASQAKAHTRAVSLSGSPITLKNDDGRGDLQFITADAAPAVYFEVESGEWRLTRVSILAAFETTSRATGDAAKVWLCDRDMNPLQSWTLPARQLSTAGDWVRLTLNQPIVMGQFVIAIEPIFQDGATLKVGVDDSSKGHSAVGKVGGTFKPLTAGEWMIRVEADTDRTSNPLLWRP